VAPYLPTTTTSGWWTAWSWRRSPVQEQVAVDSQQSASAPPRLTMQEISNLRLYDGLIRLLRRHQENLTNYREAEERLLSHPAPPTTSPVDTPPSPTVALHPIEEAAVTHLAGTVLEVTRQEVGEVVAFQRPPATQTVLLTRSSEDRPASQEVRQRPSRKGSITGNSYTSRLARRQGHSKRAHQTFQRAGRMAAVHSRVAEAVAVVVEQVTSTTK
jgi:hypothetical protein